jgi:Holliday junction resolvase-like predicted endonuclease
MRAEYDVIPTNTDMQIIVEIKYRFKQEQKKAALVWGSLFLKKH